VKGIVNEVPKSHILLNSALQEKCIWRRGGIAPRILQRGTRYACLFSYTLRVLFRW